MGKQIEMSYYQNMRPEIVKFLPCGYSKVLEIGCGEGNFRLNLQQDCEYWGIEPCKTVEKSANILTGTYEEVSGKLPDDYFDLIICNDVIEHINDTREFLLSVKKKMKKDSFIVGSVPNVRFIGNLIELLIKKDWEYKEEGVLDKTHIRFFTKKSFQRIVKDSRFIIEEIEGINGLTTQTLSVKSIAIKTLTCLLGRDSHFLQFGFRIKS
ncbi:MAG: class I SAM-dependent methyltransferase [Candidatus Schekmanbacteria bacterium]|nr:class I SAM-dependent methyltransferase [Candidatus Schekmanbacteria bacterium]